MVKTSRVVKESFILTEMSDICDGSWIGLAWICLDLLGLAWIGLDWLEMGK